MPSPTSGWGVNPAALAQLINGETPYLESWNNLEKAFKKAFGVEVRNLFEAVGKEPPRLQLFQDLAGATQEPKPLDEIMKLDAVEKVKAALQHHKDPNLVRRIIPFLLPVADAVFTTSDDPAARYVVSYGNAISAYVEDEVSYLDPVQGNASDCFLISALIALAWARPGDWRARVLATVDHGAPAARYQYQFYSEREALVPFSVEPRLPQFLGQPVYAHSANPNEAWPAMFEKAYVMHNSGEKTREPLPREYWRIGRDRIRIKPHKACQMLMGGTSYVNYDVGPVECVFHLCDERGVTCEPTMAWTFDQDSWNGLDQANKHPFSRTGLVPDHAYAVLGIIPYKSDPDYVVLRNPWGCAPEYAESHKPGPGPWKLPDGESGTAEVELNRNGVFALKAEIFEDCFSQVGWITK